MSTVIVTDSASALPPALARHWGVTVVPLMIGVEGVESPECNVDVARFYEQLGHGAVVSTSQPSPGAFIRAYEAAAQSGSERVISIHISGALSGTLNSARLAAEQVAIPVEVVDSGTASMAEGLCVLSVAAALRADSRIDTSAIVHAEVGAQRTVFITLDPRRLQTGGRADGMCGDLQVLTMGADGVKPIRSVSGIREAIEYMADSTTGAGNGSVWVGDGGAAELGGQLAAAVRARHHSLPVHRYAVPPSIGANAGPTLGLVMSPSPIGAVIP